MKYFLWIVLLLICCQHKPDPVAQAETNLEREKGMRWVPASSFSMGSDEPNVRYHERPAHMVTVNGFWIDETEVTNAQYEAFVEATGYITVAERKPEWEELRKQLPRGTPKPPDSVLVPGSLTFAPPDGPVTLDNYGQWWKWTKGANWRHPEGPGSSITVKHDHPVVHVAYEDAKAYCQWVGKRLPTEAEWEVASRGGEPARPFNFVKDIADKDRYRANVFQGSFPGNNLASDGFAATAPVRSFDPNGFGLYDMIGNVWEWTNDYYDPQYYGELAAKGVVRNPKGPEKSFDPLEPAVKKYVTKGGSYLCSIDYCSNYRPTARQASAFDSGQSHIGFRCVK